jgi:TonB family protein
MSRQLLALMLLILSVSSVLVAQSGSSPPQSPALSPATSPGDSAKLEPIKTQKADYPPEAARDGLQGQVVVKVLVSETGAVESVEVVRGDPILAKAALSAAKKWKFKPFIRGGKAIKASTEIPFDFAFIGKVEDTAPPADAPTENGKATTRVRVSQGVSQGLLIHRVQPIYPESARRYHVEGTVTLRAVISKDGRIEDLTPISGPKELIPPAMGAVQQWRYKPYLLEGQPVAIETQIIVNFQLSRR